MLESSAMVFGAANNPLEPPGDDGLLRRFCAASGLAPGSGPQALARLARAFARLPYENLSKIVSGREQASFSRARRGPQQVVAEHLELGAGGTCFALTATLAHLVRALGYRAQPILADRHYGPDTHCALLVWLEGGPHLLDPGYLVTSPLPWPTGGTSRLAGAVHDLELVARPDGRVELHTLNRAGRRHRLTFHSTPADDARFLRAWDASFDWPMMRLPVLTRLAGEGQLYLQGRRLLVRSRRGTESRSLDDQALLRVICQRFGLDRRLVVRALELLAGRGR